MKRFFIVFFLLLTCQYLYSIEVNKACKVPNPADLAKVVEGELETITYYERVPGYGDEYSKLKEIVKKRIIKGDFCPDVEWGRGPKSEGYKTFEQGCFKGGCGSKRKIDKTCILKNYDKWWEENRFINGKNTDLLMAFAKAPVLSVGIFNQKTDGTGSCAVASTLTAMSVAGRKQFVRNAMEKYHDKELDDHIDSGKGNMRDKKALPPRDPYKILYNKFMQSQVTDDGGVEPWKWETKDPSKSCADHSNNAIHIQDARAKKCFKHILGEVGASPQWLDEQARGWNEKILGAVTKGQKVLATFTCSPKVEAIPYNTKAKEPQLAHQVVILGTVIKNGKEHIQYADPISGIKTVELDMFKRAYVPGSAWSLMEGTAI